MLVGLRRSGKSYLLYQQTRKLIRKLAESVKQPCSFSRLANIVSSAGTKTRVETVAIQVAYSLNNEETLKREVGGLLKLSDRFVVNKLLIIARDERRTINIKGKTIEVVPVWQWLLEDVQVN